MKPSIFEVIRNFQLDRKNMREHNSLPANQQALLDSEIAEQKEAFDNFMRSGDPAHLIEELTDLIIRATDFMQILGADPDLEVRDKISAALIKYPAVALSNGKLYEEVMPELRENWNRKEKQAFYSITR